MKLIPVSTHPTWPSCLDEFFPRKSKGAKVIACGVVFAPLRIRIHPCYPWFYLLLTASPFFK